MTLAVLLDQWIGYFGGAAVIIAISSLWSAYNNYQARRSLRNIERILTKKEETHGEA